MARRGLAGQLNMFDLYNSLETIEPGEVEMVSLVPNFEEEPVVEKEPVIEEEPATEKEPMIEEEPEAEAESEVEIVSEDAEFTSQVEKTKEDVAMSRSYEVNGQKIEIAYINYNKVRITKGKKAPEIIEFASTKEAVDYYVERMQEFVVDEEV